jgi:peptide/nickel transport system substrate-binding protein
MEGERDVILRTALVWLVFVLGLAGCGPPSGQPARQAQTSDAPRSSAPKRITGAIRGDPKAAYHKLNVGNNFIGTQQVERLVNAGLSVPDPSDVLHPQLAEAVPSLENGLWKLLPDGRMETTWKLRQGASWHDGAPVTSADLAFTARVEQDRELAWVRNTAYDYIDRVETTDERTLTIYWKRPFVDADTMLSASSQRGLPLPKHLLEQAYADDRAGFLQLPFWSHGFVGAGPFSVKEWEPDSHIVLAAFDRYVLGRPKIDEIEIRLIPDTNAVIANILGGAVEYTMDGRSIPLEEARNLQAQWRDGHLELSVGGVPSIFPQFRNTNPPIVANLQFRRALMHAMDRQEMVDSIQGGLASVAHTWLGPEQKDFKAIEPSIVKYEYDPQRAAQLIEGLGYSRGSDGIYQDRGGGRLVIPIHTTITSINQKATLAVADYWQRAGVATDIITIPLQRQSDREFMFTLPAFHLIRTGRSLRSFNSFHSAESPLPENTFLGSNRGRYSNAELDALIDRFFVTIPRQENLQVLGQIVHHETDQLVVMRVFFDPEATMIANRLRNIPGGTPWNAQEWEVAG